MKRDVVNIAGIGVFQGDIEADLVKCAGVGKALGLIKCRRLEVEGVFSAGSRITADEVDVKGVFKTKADFSAERFHIRGAVVIDALLNAGHIDIQFDRFGKIREIGGDTINIRPFAHYHRNSFGKAMDNFMSAFTSRQFKIDVIEGNEIYLENVEVGTVRGENITIGPGCKVGYLEYTHKAKVHDSAQVIDMKGLKQAGM